MRLALILLTAALVAADISKPDQSAVAPMATACYGPDAYSAAQITSLIAIAGATSPAGAQWRDSVYLPAVSASSISLVSDSTVCARGLAAFNSAAHKDSAADKVYLFGVGDMYVAANPHFPAGEWVEHFVFDSSFTFKAAYLK